MEEQVGELWHRLVTRLAYRGFPDAAVRLADVERSVGVMFRALGGDGGLQVTTAESVVNQAKRSWLQRLGGAQERISLAWRDDTFLRLPALVDWLPEETLNRELYLWLAAMAVSEDVDAATGHRKPAARTLDVTALGLRARRTSRGRPPATRPDPHR